MTIKLERYSVYPYSTSTAITGYAVSKGHGGKDLVVFGVNDAYPQEEQRMRAVEYCTYMNKIVDATEEAYSQTQLADTLKR